MLNETINSLQYLVGLSPNAPIYITVDRPESYAHPRVSERTTPEKRLEEERRLEQYIGALYAAFANKKNHQIVVNGFQLHIGGSVKKALGLFDPETKYLYYVQHDFKFAKEINHTAIVRTMEEYPHIVRLVRFSKRAFFVEDHEHICRNLTEADMFTQVNGITLTKTYQWSDNNHFATVKHYGEILARVSSVERPLEGPMLHTLKKKQAKVAGPGGEIDCSLYDYWGPYMHGTPRSSPDINHTDGREVYAKDNIYGN